MPERRYSKERLEKSRKLFLDPDIDIELNAAIKRLQEGSMTEFLQAVMIIDRDVEHHIMNNCAKAENEDIRIDCVTKAENIKRTALNKLSEALVGKCGGEMHYLEDENQKHED